MRRRNALLYGTAILACGGGAAGAHAIGDHTALLYHVQSHR